MYENSYKFLLFCAFLVGCGSSKQLKTSANFESFAEAAWTKNHFTGFLLIDAISKDTLYDHNSEKYFTPASNTKIFTLYTALQLLPENIPALKYTTQGDTLYFEGTGDPTLLHPYFKDSTLTNFLRQQRTITWDASNFGANLLGAGWSADDYQFAYQVERGALPIYGNVTTISRSNALEVTPALFTKAVLELNYPINRETDSNTFYYSSTEKDTLTVPYKTSTELTKTLLENAIGQEISVTDKMPEEEKTVLYGVATDSVCKRMMQQSDNFLAEQLLVLASGMVSDTLNDQTARDFVLDNSLASLQQPPRWVDGSGLSRYNLFTPESMVHVLDKMYAEIPQQRLFNIFPAGGVSGTLENSFAGETEPYLYAKSGSLSNNYALSGYLITKKGRVLIFSFMNNHYTLPSSEIKSQMERILKNIRDAY